MFARNWWIRELRRSCCPPALNLALLAAAIGILLGAPQQPAYAVSLDKGAASNRPAGEQSSAVLPMPNAQSAETLDQKLAAKRLNRGSPVLVRIFKEESELELWMKKDARFVHFATYPICDWSGGLGPKLIEGDKQSPEGFYTIRSDKLHRSVRWPHSFDLGFPNVLDRSLLRTGSYLLIHGGCSSRGCYAMTDAIMAQIHELISQSIEAGQDYIQIHIFPFRMSEPNLARHSKSDWHAFWLNLKEGYDAFERTRLPPLINVCDGRYQFRDARVSDASNDAPLTACAETAAILQSERKLREIVRKSQWEDLPDDDRKLLTLLPLPIEKIAAQQAAARPPSPNSGQGRGKADVVAGSASLKCNLGLPSCRRFLALKQRRMQAAKTKATKRKRGIATARSVSETR